MSKPWRKIWKKLHQQHYVFELILVLVIVAAVGITIKNIWPSDRPFRLWSETIVPVQELPLPMAPQENLVRRAIDGVKVAQGQENPPLVAVMAENMIEAQPISGIDKASLVFESVTEANITRFLAIFALDDSPSSRWDSNESGVLAKARDFVIGPVRSARPYYLDWAAELGALYTHVGGSPEANQLIKKGIVNDLDQWFKSQYFRRDTKKPGPHNVYTSADLLKQAIQQEEFEQKVFAPWQFKDEAAIGERGAVEKITVGYNAPYDVTWQYDKGQNEYTRQQWGGPHKTTNGSEIKAKNIAVAWLPMKILDEVGRKWFGTTGQGKAVVFQDGQAIKSTWRKPSRGERMKFFDESGEEIEFNAGTTWVEIVPTNYNVQF